MPSSRKQKALQPEAKAALMGVGACLAGQLVRYDGSPNPANAAVQKIGDHFQLKPFCPEVGIGLPVPRPPIHLVGTTETVRVLDVATHSQDYTQSVQEYARRLLSEQPELCAYVLVNNSPSCGYRAVKRFSAGGSLVARDSRGIHAAAMAQYNPLLPLEDDLALLNPLRAASFITRACAYYNWQTIKHSGAGEPRQKEFLALYAHIASSHDPGAHARLEALLSGRFSPETSIHHLMGCMALNATRRNHCQVLLTIGRSLAANRRRKFMHELEALRQGEQTLAGTAHALLQFDWQLTPAQTIYLHSCAAPPRRIDSPVGQLLLGQV